MVAQKPKKKLSSGCLVALVVVGLVGAMALLHLVIAAYFLFSKFEVVEMTYSDSETEASRVAPDEVPASEVAP